MKGDEKNKALVERLIDEYKKRGLNTFLFKWEGSRVPATVTFPDGIEKKVGYMRDGFISFADGTNAVYDRLEDYPCQPLSMYVGYDLSKHRKE